MCLFSQAPITSPSLSSLLEYREYRRIREVVTLSGYAHWTDLNAINYSRNYICQHVYAIGVLRAFRRAAYGHFDMARARVKLAYE